MNLDNRRFALFTRPLLFTVVALFSIILIVTQMIVANAKAPVADAFAEPWARSDKPVADGEVQRSWIWGPEGLTGPIEEEYEEAPNGRRLVQYFDKSRMEITNPAGDADNLWYVTNGLLVTELVTGRLQLGNARFADHVAANVGVAGDPDDTTGPTYKAFQGLMTAPAYDPGAAVTLRINRQGQISEDPVLADYGVTAAHQVEMDMLDRQIASPFWEFMNVDGLVYDDGEYVTDNLLVDWLYAVGYPIAEAYWADVKVAGVQRDVLIQCFERRCLTYTPSNDEGWRVEAGNVGQHYYQWRSDLGTGEPTPSPAPTETMATDTPVASETPSSTATSTATATNTPSPTRTPTPTEEPDPTETPTTPATETPNPNPPFETGRANKVPWSGHWWPFEAGSGMTLYEDGGPLQRYDEYVAAVRGTASNAQGWEQNNHGSGAAWWGHCYSWAAASILEAEPEAVTKAGVSFTQDDIEGMLAEAYSRPGQRLWGSESRAITPAELDAVVRDYVGKQSRSVIMDLDPGDQIWNYPIYAYERTAERTGMTTKVAMTLSIAVPRLAYSGTDTDTVSFTYTLSSSGPGQWTGNSVENHPNFLWSVTNRGTSENPWVNYSVVKEIMS